jgi:cytochrome c oxidase cbb3-type subunit 3
MLAEDIEIAMKVLFKTPLAALAITATAALPFLPSVAAQNAPPAPAIPARAQSTVGSQGALPEHTKFTAAQIDAGGGLFLQNCAFCHGKDASGGESGPDLTRSKIVSGDKNGEGIGAVIRNGRPEKGMPRFSLADNEVVSLVAFIHAQQDKAMSQTGVRKGVEDSDLLTGNAQAGKQYFEGTGGCVKCHSATGDLAGVAKKFTGLRLEQEMLYPRDAKTKVTVKTGTGQTLTGIETYKDEFVIGMTDSFGVYHSWPVTAVTYKEDSPVDAHVDAFSKYTDDDIHNLYAYIVTLK